MPRLSLALALALTGCSSFGEVHFARSVDEHGSGVNYFRVKVSGWTFLSSSRYLSGYFDESAVDAYFNEIGQPEEGRIGREPLPSIHPVGDDRAGKKLVMILSTNSDAVADQIGAYADNEQVGRAITRILHRDRLAQSAQASTDLQIQLARGRLLDDLGRRLIDPLDEQASAQAVDQAMLQLVNTMAAQEGNLRPFETLDEAEQWFTVARSIRRGE